MTVIIESFFDVKLLTWPMEGDCSQTTAQLEMIVQNNSRDDMDGIKLCPTFSGPLFLGF
jgi:hypothetical protein